MKPAACIVFLQVCASSSSETLVTTYPTTRCRNPEPNLLSSLARKPKILCSRIGVIFSLPYPSNRTVFLEST
jgi:hypothetical protein